MHIRHSNTNEYGGYTWEFKINTQLFLFIKSKNDDLFCIEFKEKKWFNYKTIISYSTNGDLLHVLNDSIDRVKSLIDSSGKFKWSEAQKENKLIELQNSLKLSEDKVTQSFINKKESASRDEIVQPTETTNETFKFLAINAYSENDFYIAHTYAEIYLQKYPLDIEINLLSLSAVIKINGKPIYQQEKFLKRSIELVRYIRSNKKSGQFSLTEKQEERFKALVKEQLAFWDKSVAKDDFNHY